MSVSARARGHLDVARVTEQQQGMADEVVFTLVLIDFLDGKSLGSPKVGVFDRFSVQIAPYPSRGNRSLSKFSRVLSSKASRWRESGIEGVDAHRRRKQQMVDYA